MKNSTLAIILALVMSGVALWMSLENRKLIALQINMLDNMGQAINETIEETNNERQLSLIVKSYGE